MLHKRLNRMSKTVETFKVSITKYQKALTNSNFKHKLKYLNHQNNQNKKNLLKPTLLLINTNTGKAFLKLIDKHFKEDHKLNKIININSCKISYSCTSNNKKLVQKHNRKDLQTKKAEENETLCNCRTKLNFIQ